MFLQYRLGVGVDYRANVGGGIGRVADHQRVDGADQRRDQLVCGLLRYEQQPQCRAALPGRTERGDDDVVDHLFLERGGVDEHRVETAGFGNERQDRAGTVGELPVDDPGGVGAAGEGDAVDERVADQLRADGRAVARQQREQVGVEAGAVEQPDRLGGDEGVCRRGFASTALPAASAAAIWPVKIASGKFHGLMHTKVPRPRSSRWFVSPTGPVSGWSPENCFSARCA